MITVLHFGVDTLEASFKGKLCIGLMKYLEEAKVEAQQDGVPTVFEALPSFVMNPRGVKPWTWLLKGEDLHLRLSADKYIPTVSAKLLSVGIAANGHEGMYEEAKKLAASLGAHREIGLSRLDVAVDFQGWVPTVADSANMVCPAEFRPIYPSIEKPQTFQFGQGQLVVRMYNKTEELKKSGKSWLETAWRMHPDYDPGQDVWRIEAQLRREVLRELRCESVEAAFANLGRIFGSALSWCELRVPKGKVKTRWRVDPRWEALKRAARAGKSLPRVRLVRGVGSVRRLVPQITGLLASCAAHLGVTELEALWYIMEKEIQAHLRSKGSSFCSLAGERRRKVLGE